MKQPSSAAAVVAMAERIFGSDWAAPLARLTGVNPRTLLRIKVAAKEGRDYPAARGVLAAMDASVQDIARLMEKVASDFELR